MRVSVKLVIETDDTFDGYFSPKNERMKFSFCEDGRKLIIGLVKY